MISYNSFLNTHELDYLSYFIFIQHRMSVNSNFKLNIKDYLYQYR